MSLDQFWLPAWDQEANPVLPSGGRAGSPGVDGNDVLMNAFEPDVVYDAASGRWYVSAPG